MMLSKQEGNKMFKYVPNIMPKNIVIIGCGGNGSRVVPLIAQMVKSQSWIINPCITLIDGDNVEASNLVRQNFIEPDIGRNKAEVLADRYSNAYGVDINCHKNYIDDNTKLANILKHNNIGITKSSQVKNIPFIIIMCVDSIEARHKVLKSIITSGLDPRSVIIDSGNEDTFGQVEYFNLYSMFHAPSDTLLSLSTISNNGEDIIEMDIMPFPINKYLNRASSKSTRSCADMDQTLAINSAIASTIAGIFQNLLFSIPMEYNILRIDLGGGSSTGWLTLDWFKSTLGIKVDTSGYDDYLISNPGNDKANRDLRKQGSDNLGISFSVNSVATSLPVFQPQRQIDTLSSYRAKQSKVA